MSETTTIQQKPNVMQNTITNVNDRFLPQIEQQLNGHNITFNEYQRVCVLNALSAINTVLESKGITWNDAQLDKSNITQTLLRIATLKLNASAQPREVFFQLRNVKFGNEWKKQIETGIEGDGNDAILRNFGINIKKIGQYWLVREGDDFTYPSFNGFEQAPPKWTPKGGGKVIRVVYPIMKNDGTCEFWISERADVKKNLIAHINQNLMNETFGICADRYKATEPQKKQIAEKKKAIIDKLSGMALDEILDCQDVAPWISPSWSEPQSRESMIERKMRNNATKKIPKNFGNAFAEQMYHEASDESVASALSERTASANTGDYVDVDFEEVPESTANATEQTDNGEIPVRATAERVEPPQDTAPANTTPKRTSRHTTATTAADDDGQVSLGNEPY